MDLQRMAHTVRAEPIMIDERLNQLKPSPSEIRHPDVDAGLHQQHAGLDAVVGLVVEEVADGLPGRVRALHACAVAVTHGELQVALGWVLYPGLDGGVERFTPGAQLLPVVKPHAVELAARRQVEQRFILVGQHQMVERAVATETLRRMAALGLRVWQGPTLQDIDEAADLAHLPHGFLPASY